jgi:geranylgeranyl diphosphate synthase type II
MQYQIQNILPLVEEALSNFKYPVTPVSLYDPVRYFMGLPGKRIRPIFVLQALELFRKPEKKDAIAAIATELFHNFSLVHDDIMDQADLRRGFQTVHKKWDEPTALLSGDSLLIFAYQALLAAPENGFKQLISRFNEMSLAVCEGQQLDMDFSLLRSISVEQYLEMIDLKTGALISFSFEMAGFLAEESLEVRHSLRGFGAAMGRCFQLRDDFLDLFGNELLTGKKLGGDIGNSKLTYPVLCSFSHIEGAEFRKYWDDKSIDSERRISLCLKWMNQNGIANLCLDLIDSEMEKGLSLLTSINGDFSAKERLETLCKSLTYREK